jgi:hypothetical protein
MLGELFKAQSRSDRQLRMGVFLLIFESNYSQILAFLPFPEHHRLNISKSDLIQPAEGSTTSASLTTFGLDSGAKSWRGKWRISKTFNSSKKSRESQRRSKNKSAFTPSRKIVRM